MLDHAALKNEILTGPLSASCAPHVTAGNHNAIADLLNTDPAGVRTVVRKSMTRGGMLKGLIPATDRLAAGVGVSAATIPDTTASKWQARLESLRAGNPDIELDAAMLEMLGQLVADDLATQGEIDAITQHSISAAEFAIGRLATANDVWEVLL